MEGKDCNNPVQYSLGKFTFSLQLIVVQFPKEKECAIFKNYTRTSVPSASIVLENNTFLLFWKLGHNQLQAKREFTYCKQYFAFELSDTFWSELNDGKENSRKRAVRIDRGNVCDVSTDKLSRPQVNSMLYKAQL